MLRATLLRGALCSWSSHYLSSRCHSSRYSSMAVCSSHETCWILIIYETPNSCFLLDGFIYACRRCCRLGFSHNEDKYTKKLPVTLTACHSPQASRLSRCSKSCVYHKDMLLKLLIPRAKYRILIVLSSPRPSLFIKIIVHHSPFPYSHRL